VDGDIEPFPEKEHGEQGDYHGTPCAGVAIAEENGIGCTGIAPGCAFMLSGLMSKIHQIPNC